MTQAQGRFIPLSGLLAAGRAGDFPVCVDAQRSVAWRDFALLCGGIVSVVRARPEQRWLVHCEHPQPAMTAQLRSAYDAVLGDGPQPMLDLSTLAPSSFRFEALEPKAARIDLYTSGSSGEPKRVEKSLHQLETEARALETSFGASLGAATMVATVPHHHIYGLLFRLIWPLCAGRRFDARLCADPQLLTEALGRCGDAALVSSPAHLARLPELIPLDALQPATRRIFSSGGPLPAAAAVEYRNRLGFAPTEIYGSTESGGIAWREQDGSEESAAWRPFPGMALRTQADGALCLRSPYLPDDNWLTMGDAAALLPDGRFRLKGRLDRVVKVEGKRISLPEIEQALRAHPWVADAAVVPLARSRERVVAGLRDFLLERFERVLVPRQWRFVARLPADERGKLTAAALHALFRKADDAPTA